MNATITENKVICKKFKDPIIHTIIKCGRKVIGEIWHPSPITNYKYDVTVKVAPGFVLKAVTNDLPTAWEEFDRLTDSKYQFN